MTGALEGLGVIGRQQAALAPGLRHLELFTFDGLLTVLWHGDPAAEGVVIACGGALGGLLGPADGLYQDLGSALAERGIATLRVDYRRPNDLGSCTHDLVAVAELAARQGAERFVLLGHSFGGAVAVRAAAALGDLAVGVVTLATQSAGCEVADQLGGRPLLLFHGDGDELLPPKCSLTVRALAGAGEVVILPGAGHLLTEAGDELRRRLLEWVPDVLSR